MGLILGRIDVDRFQWEPLDSGIAAEAAVAAMESLANAVELPGAAAISLQFLNALGAPDQILLARVLERLEEMSACGS